MAEFHAPFFWGHKHVYFVKYSSIALRAGVMALIMFTALNKLKILRSHNGRRTLWTRHSTAQEHGIPQRHDGRQINSPSAPKKGAILSLFLGLFG